MLCICVCVCERERESWREREIKVQMNNLARCLIIIKGQADVSK